MKGVRVNGVRLLTVAVTFALVVPTGVVLTDAGSAQQADVSITGASVSVDSPSPGERFVVTTNLSNWESSNESVEVTDVFVRRQGSTKEYARVENVGTLDTGTSVSVPLGVTIDEAGQTNLRVHATVRTESGDTRQLSYPVLVDVQESNDVLLSVPTTEATAGDATTVNATVSNGNNREISAVRLDVDGDGTAENPERVTAAIDSKVDESFQYDVTFDTPGTRTLNFSLTYTTSGGATRTITKSAPIDVAPEGAGTSGIEGEIRLTGVETMGSGVVTLQGDAANIGGTNVESVLLTVEETDSVRPMGSSGEYFVGAVNASTFDVFELTAQVDQSATAVPIRISYIVDGERTSERVSVNLTDGVGGEGPAMGTGPDEDSQQRFTPPSNRQSGSGSGLLGTYGLPLLAIAGIAGIGYYVRRRR